MLLPTCNVVTSQKLRLFKSNLTAVLEQLRELGYEASATKLTASHYGLPQRRCRYYIVAVRDVFAEGAAEIVQKVQGLLPKLKVNTHPDPEVHILISRSCCCSCDDIDGPWIVRIL